MLRGHCVTVHQLERWPRSSVAPRPDITKPELREYVDYCRLRSAISGGDLNQDVIRPGLRVLNENIKVAVVVERAGINEFILRMLLAAPAGFSPKHCVRKILLRILVEHLLI